ncbi:MAG: hypothetical protein GY754_09275 [bacterium]|nr:hypothetical protein [bacterium]
MKYSQKEIYSMLNSIYEKHSKKYKQHSKPEQMCCMWSTSDPPDVIEDTDPFRNIEDVFDISLEEDDCLELYDMNIDEATAQIANIIKQQC